MTARYTYRSRYTFTTLSPAQFESPISAIPINPIKP